MTAQISKTIDTCDASLQPQAEQVRTALEDVQAMTATLTGYLMAASEEPAQIYKVGLASVRFLLAVGDLLIGWLLLGQAAVAHAALSAGASTGDEAFYRGKITTARYFAANMLPRLGALRGIIENLDDEIMFLPESAF